MAKLNIKRVVGASVLAGMVLGGSITAVVTRVDWSYSVSQDCEYVSVRAYEGDTVSKLVREYNKGADVDYRDLVQVFKKENGTVSIIAGEMYQVPVYK